LFRLVANKKGKRTGERW